MLTFRRRISLGFCLAESLHVHWTVSLALLNFVAISYVAVDLDFLSKQHHGQKYKHTAIGSILE